MKKKDLFLGGGILFAACVLFLVMNLMQYVQAKESGQKENQEKQVVIKVDGEVYGRYALRMEKLIWKRLTVRMDIAKSRGRSITGHRQLSACLISWLWK